MTVVPGTDGQTMSLVCDSCGASVRDIESPCGQWPLIWAIVSVAGWTGTSLSFGPHYCPGCSGTVTR